MRDTLLDILRCPFCGSQLAIVENDALVRTGGSIDSAVLGCDCCAFPVVAGIPVLIADDTTRDAMHQLEAGQREEALFTLLGLDEARGSAFRALLGNRGATYKDALAILSLDAEADCFLYRFSDPTYLTIEALVQALGQNARTRSGPVLDLCGGSGHVTRVLAALKPSGGVIDADLHFWKLWMAKRFTVPQCEAMCCDANSPLPFARDTFSMTILADAFPYIWHKRLLADELIRSTGPDGVILMPHLHSTLGENFTAGMTLTPEGYRNLFALHQPRLFSDERLFDGVFHDRIVDLTRDASPAELGDEPSFTLIASVKDDLFKAYRVAEPGEIEGELRVNPLYRIDQRGESAVLTLAFPTPEYEEEFGACKEYLPSIVNVHADVTGPIALDALGADGEELRRRRVIIDAPPYYC
jgi:uncharacterized protein YbaR (Trm112 family)/SAM-dependent methyltransferase